VKTYSIAYACFLVPMLAIDAVWLVTMSKRFYAVHLGSLMEESPRFVPAAIFYLLYALGPAVLVVVRAVNNDTNFLKVFGLGALFGLVAYGTYDLTNQATLKGWKTIVTTVDLVWGALLTGAVSIIAVALTRVFV
jgi:uncharacterized membrane protein